MSDTSLSVSQNLLTAVNFPENNAFGKNITNLTNSVSTLNTEISKSDAIYTDALNQNTLTNNIINNEIARLKTQESVLQNAQIGQKRILNLNDSYRKRYGQYLKMVVIISIILVIVCFN